MDSVAADKIARVSREQETIRAGQNPTPSDAVDSLDLCRENVRRSNQDPSARSVDWIRRTRRRSQLRRARKTAADDDRSRFNRDDTRANAIDLTSFPSDQTVSFATPCTYYREPSIVSNNILRGDIYFAEGDYVVC